jgi:hypothetical protein
MVETCARVYMIVAQAAAGVACSVRGCKILEHIELPCFAGVKQHCVMIIIDLRVSQVCIETYCFEAHS